MLLIHNSLTGRKEPFRPLQPGRVRMYVCGVTVYDHIHLGHARMMVVFDVVVRHLRASGLDVTYVRNITDVDDKIIRRAAEEGVSCQALTERYIGAMNEDLQALGVLAPNHEPRATERIDDIIAMIGKLIDGGFAYAAENGDVYYDVSRFEGYGRLSGKRIDELRAGVRVEVGEAKADPVDFVLWKAAKPGEPQWPSPWGPGRPGWHIECSAMSTSCLGPHFDIHGGGLDLKFPHHENEIAQSEAATGETFVNVWMHNGFVQVGDEKMSKSLGNFRTVRDVLRHYRAEEVRCFILGSHYRSPLSYTEQAMDAACGGLARLYTALRGLPLADATVTLDAFGERFQAAMDDDFNTPVALSVLFDMAREINRRRDTDGAAAAALAAGLVQLGGRLGLLQQDPEAFLKGGAVVGPTAEEIEAMIAERKAARGRRDFAAADRIRDQLAEQGIQLEDKPGGETLWRRL